MIYKCLILTISLLLVLSACSDQKDESIKYSNQKQQENLGKQENAQKENEGLIAEEPEMGFSNKPTLNYVSVLGGSNLIYLPNQLVEQIVGELNNATETIVISEYKDTEYEFISMGIEVFLHDMYYEYSVLMWINKEGIKAIGMGNEEIPISSKAYDLIVNYLNNKTNWQEGWLPSTENITKISLEYAGEVIAVVEDSDSIYEISEIIRSSKCVVGGSGCPFEAKLILEYKDKDPEILKLASDSCAIFIAGSSTYYDFGKCNTTYGDKTDVKRALLNFFGITDFK